jgi:hypothetical protein
MMTVCTVMNFVLKARSNVIFSLTYAVRLPKLKVQTNISL